MSADATRSTRPSELRWSATILIIALMTAVYLQLHDTGILERLQLAELGELVAVADQSDLSYSGTVDGEVWILRPPEDAPGGGTLAEAISERLVVVGCESLGMLSGHPGGTETIVAEQWNCGDSDVELGWRSDRTDVDLVVGRATGLHR